MARTRLTRCVGWLALVGSAFGATLCSAGFPLPDGFERDPVLEGYALQTWRREQGLSNTTITVLRQSREGYLWLGTSSGLVRFDGHRFEVFNRSNIPGLRSSRIRTLLEDRHGALWVGGFHSGLLRRVGHHWSEFSAEQGITSGNIFAIHESPEGEVWVNDDGTILRFVDDRFEPVDFSHPSCPPLRVEKIAFTGGGDVWSWGSELLVRHSGGQCVEVIPLASLGGQGEPTRIASRHLIATRDGAVWLGSVDEILKLSATLPRTVERRWWNRSVDAFMEDSNGNLWIGTSSGLMRYRDGVVESLTEREGLADNRVWALLEDREGALWLGTYDGLQRLRRGRIRTLSSKQGLRSDFIWGVYRASDGSVLIGHRSGGDRLMGGVIEPIPFADPQAESPLRCFLEDSKGRLWVGAESGPHLLVDGVLRPWSAAPAELAHRQITSFYETPSQSLWMATRLGAFELTAEGQLSRAVLPDRHVLAIHQDRRGDLWLGAEDGLYRLRGDELERFPTGDGPSFWVRAIYEGEDGILWLGTVGHGLLRFDGRDFAGFDTRQGLSDDNVWRIFDDGQGQFWLCSDVGIFSVSIDRLERSLRDGSDVGSRLFGVSDGLLNRECNGGYYPSAFRDEQGRLWFPTAGGVAVVTTGRQEAHPLTFSPLIEAVRIDERETAIGSPWVVPYDTRSLEVKLTVPEFVDADRVVLSYRMVGLDPDWRIASESRTAVYGRLPPGSYQFEVKAGTASGRQSAHGLSANVEVPYPLGDLRGLTSSMF